MLTRHHVAVALTTLLLVLAATQPAHAVPLINGFGGPAGYGTNSLPANDDGYSSATVSNTHLTLPTNSRV